MTLFAACAFIVAAVLSCAWVSGQFACPGVDRTNGYVSELAARNQPWSPLFRVTDALAGLSCLLGVAFAPRLLTSGRRWEWAGWLALALLGLMTVADAIFPLDCAALSDPACEKGPLSFSHHVHAVTSVLSVAGLLASMVLLSRSWVAWTLTAALAAVSVFMLAAMARGTLVGLAQRVQVALIACWLVYVAVRLLTREEVRQAGRLHVVEQGQGPTVIITAGMAGAWHHWDEVAGELAADHHHVVRFDRPGLGLSPAPTITPTLHGEAARLAALPPREPEHVTVVAHSVAAWHAEAFARLHPLRVKALVLVDPSVEPYSRRGTSQAGRAIARWLPALGQTWGAAAAARVVGPAVHRLITGERDGHRVYRDGKVLVGAVGEWLAYRDMAAELREIRREHALPAIPVTILSAGKGTGHAELAGLLNATLVRLPRAAHHVQFDDPGAIVLAV